MELKGTQRTSKELNGMQGTQKNSRELKETHGNSRELQVWELLEHWNIVELIKQSRPLIHNHVPALTCNGMIGPVLV